MVDRFQSADPRVDWQLELHVVGAHVCLTKFDRNKVSSVWVTWLPLELPHVAVCGVLHGKRFRYRWPLWKNNVAD